MSELHASVVRAIDELFNSSYSALSEARDVETVIALLHHASYRFLEVEINSNVCYIEIKSLKNVIEADDLFVSVLQSKCTGDENQRQDAQNAVRSYFFKSLYPQWVPLLLQGNENFV
jgi:hypothetical protein